MLSLAKIIRGKGVGAEYYLKCATVDYYKGGGEPVGQWIGKGSALIDLSGEVEATHLLNIIQGFDAHTGAQLTQEGRKVQGYDLTFSAPKSVSLVWALGDAELHKKIDEAQQRAASKGIQYLEEHSMTRRGHQSLIHEKHTGLIVASFRHSTSREEDPQLHTHCLVSNLCQREDGTFGTIEGSSFFKHKMTAGAIYRAEMAAELRGMGFELEEDEADSFKIVGVSQDACEVFSKRRNEIEDYLQKNGLSDAKSSANAALATRQKKEEVSFFEKKNDWVKEAEPFNLTPESINEMKTFKEVEKTIEASEVLQLLTEKSSTFREQDIVKMLAIKAQTIDFDREAMLQTILKSEELIRLTGYDDGQKRFTSKEMLNIERGLIDYAKQASATPSHTVLNPIEDQIKTFEESKGFELNNEQKEAVKYLTQDSGGVACVEGMAGTGKTTMLEATRQIFEKEGFHVVGCALAGKAAKGLEEGAGIKSSTIHSTLTSIEKGKLILTDKSVVVVDEAGMIGTRLYQGLVEQVKNAGAKLILVGDYKQLQPIDAGGMFKQITKTSGSVELVEIRRQKEEWQREAVSKMAAGNVKDVIDTYLEKGLLKVGEDKAQTIEKMVKTWSEDPTEIKEKLMLAATTFEASTLNGAAREILKSNGSILDYTSTKVQTEERGIKEFCIGDRIIFLKNDSGLDVKNGEFAEVKMVEYTKSGEPLITVEMDSGDFKTLDTEKYNSIDHGYCVSVHKSQGATVDKAYVLTNESMSDREWSYVATSRSRYETMIFTTSEEFADMDRIMSASNQKDSTLDYSKIEEPAQEAPAATVEAAQPEAVPAVQPAAQPQPVAPAAPVAQPTPQRGRGFEMEM